LIDMSTADSIKQTLNGLLERAKDAYVLLPQDASEARRLCGTILMSRRKPDASFDIDAAFEDIKVRFGIHKKAAAAALEKSKSFEKADSEEEVLLCEAPAKKDAPVVEVLDDSDDCAAAPKMTTARIPKKMRVAVAAKSTAPNNTIDRIPKKRKTERPPPQPSSDNKIQVNVASMTLEEINTSLKKYGIKKMASKKAAGRRLIEILTELNTQAHTTRNEAAPPKKAASKKPKGSSSDSKEQVDGNDADGSAKKKKKTSKKAEFVHEENRPLAEAFRSLGGYAMKDGSGNARFKGGTYMKAAKAFREYEEVIESGRQLKGKIKGVGPKVMALVDEFMETGVIAELQEYKATFGDDS